MASATAQAFHNDTMEQTRRALLFRVQQGTKASSPGVRNYRRSHLQINQPHAGLPDNSEGSKIRPFFMTQDQSSKPLGMKGGVLHTPEGQAYGKRILARRAADVRRMEMESAEGINPNVAATMAQEPSVLSGQDSRILELNTLLNSIDDAIGTGEIGGLTLQELKNIPRLLIGLVWAFSDEQLGNYVQYTNELIDTLEGLQERESEPNRRKVASIKQFVENVRNFLRAYAPSANLDESSRIAAVRGLAKEYFGLKFSRPEMVEQPAAAPTVAALPLPGGPGGPPPPAPPVPPRPSLQELREQARVTRGAEPEAPAPAPPAPPAGAPVQRRVVAQGLPGGLTQARLEQLRMFYREGNVSGLNAFIASNISSRLQPRSTRTQAANIIESRLGVAIKS